MAVLIVLALLVAFLIVYRMVTDYHRRGTPFPPQSGIPRERPKLPECLTGEGFMEDIDDRGWFLGFRRIEQDEAGARYWQHYDEAGNKTGTTKIP